MMLQKWMAMQQLNSQYCDFYIGVLSGFWGQFAQNGDFVQNLAQKAWFDCNPKNYDSSKM